MTIEQLLGLSSKEWDTISDEALTKFLTPYIKITRPNPERLNRMKEARIKKPIKRINNRKQAQEILSLIKDIEGNKKV